MSAGHGFREAVKYYLPKLLLVPICHAFLYFDYIKHLMDLSTSQDDIESFAQVQGLLHPLHCDLEKVMANLSKERLVPVSGRVRRQMAIERTRELQLKVEHWDDKDVGLNCNEFIRGKYVKILFNHSIAHYVLYDLQRIPLVNLAQGSASGASGKYFFLMV